MQAYRDMYNVMEGNFDGCELRHVGRESNEEADMLANIGSRKESVPPGVFLERIKERSVKINNPAESAVDTSTPQEQGANVPADQQPDNLLTLIPPVAVFLIEPSWTKPFLSYITCQELPSDPVEAKRITRRSKAFTFINKELYKRSISGIL